MTAALTHDDVTAVIDLAVLVALDPAISAVAIRDSLVVLSSRPSPAPPTVEPLVVLAHARAEAWRQLRARGQHSDIASEVRIDAEPLHALTPEERTVLFLAFRRGLAIEDVAFVLGVGVRRARRLRRRAPVALVRSVTALALAMDLTPCPVRDEIAARGAGMLSRRDVDALTMHAAECSICVEWLRRADRSALEGYRSVAAPDQHHVDLVLADFMTVDEEVRSRLVARAGELRRDGRPPAGSRLDADPAVWLRRGIGFGIASAALVLTALMVMAL